MKADPTPLGDADVRPALRRTLLAKRAAEADAVVLEGLGGFRRQVRPDLAVVNGDLHGHELLGPDRDARGHFELFRPDLNDDFRIEPGAGYPLRIPAAKDPHFPEDRG
ncbi:MAG: hypothetical protein HY814_08145 [Candidatus Riflebacteria bacterium]|nr:hypothetical protein [Candidatus Riflebacteria bacterium]